MANIPGRRMMAEIDGDFVVFLIGARFNTFHLLQTFWAAASGAAASAGS
jgi:hypothetical protein